MQCSTWLVGRGKINLQALSLKWKTWTSIFSRMAQCFTSTYLLFCHFYHSFIYVMLLYSDISNFTFWSVNILKCKICFLDELGNFKQKFFYISKCNFFFALYNNGPILLQDSSDNKTDSCLLPTRSAIGKPMMKCGFFPVYTHHFLGCCNSFSDGSN